MANFATEQDRASALNFLRGGVPLVIASGSLTQPERQAAWYQYSGIAAPSPSTSKAPTYYGFQRVLGPKQISGSSVIYPKAGMISEVFVSSMSAGATLAVYDGVDATGRLVVDTFPLVAGYAYLLPFGFGTGIYLQLTGTAELTVGFLPSC
jgi:hypothetical protein